MMMLNKHWNLYQLGYKNQKYKERAKYNMQYDKENINNKFVVITANYKGYIDGDINEIQTACFDNDKFDLISSVMTIFQDIDINKGILNKKVNDYLKETKEKLDEYEHFEKCIEFYFKHYHNINILDVNNNAISELLDVLDSFVSSCYDSVSFSFIEIIKDNYVLDILDPSETDIKQSVEYIINWLKNLT